MLTGLIRFWPWGAFVGQTNNPAGAVDSMYTDPMDVAGYSSIESVFRLDMGFMGPVGATLTVTPQISADGLAWVPVAGAAFGPVAPATPTTVAATISPLYRWMRYQISVTMPAAGTYGGVFDITGIGRSN